MGKEYRLGTSGGADGVARRAFGFAVLRNADDAVDVADKIPERGHGFAGEDKDPGVRVAVAPDAKGGKRHHDVAEPVG